MTFLFGFLLSSFNGMSVLLGYNERVAESSLALEGQRAPVPCPPLFFPLERFGRAATAGKEGCFLIPTCTGLTCLRNRSGWGTASLCSCCGLGVTAGSRGSWASRPPVNG